MLTKDLLKKIRKIEIVTERLVRDRMAGQYHSVFKGSGIAFSEVRQYMAGDDIRLIDWNVSARMNDTYVKLFTEEREMTVLLLVDMSASGRFGSRVQEKRELAAEIAAILAFSAIRNNDRVGLVELEDPETGEVVVFDTSGPEGRAFAREARRAIEARDGLFRRLDMDALRVSTEKPYLPALTAFFEARARRLRH